MRRFLASILTIMMFLLSAVFAEESELQEFVLFDGEATVSGNWELATSVNTTNAQGSFDPVLISEDGYFTVEYIGSMRAVYLAFSDWQTSKWVSVNVPSSCAADDELLTATFSFDQCFIQYGSKDFSAVDQVCVGSTTAAGSTTIRRITWHGRPLQDDLGADEILFRGAATANAVNSNMAFSFTKHVGGAFDAAQIAEGARFYAEYTGPEHGIYLALSSHSGGAQWARVNASEVVDLADGKHGATFTYDAIKASWGTNFARLDQITVFSATAQQVTLHRLAYFAGEGAPVDVSAGRWARPDTGIAFIGDSICQNALLMYGDWNKILGRTDCCNYGIGGQTTVELRARIEELAQRDYQMVVFICGINDIGRGYTKEEIVANFDAMIAAIREQNPDCQFLLVSVLPTTSAFYTGQQAKIHLLNMAYKRYASKTPGVTYVDAYPSFTAKIGEYAYPELLSDGLHPNLEGYKKMAEAILPYLPVQE